VVYANAITSIDHDEKTGEDVEHGIPYMKDYPLDIPAVSHTIHVESAEAVGWARASDEPTNA
jgi:hypothetical protein